MPRPRAVGELFRAAQADGWASSLASSACATFARHAYNSWETLPSLFENSNSVGSALRRVVDDARLEALSDASYVDAGLVMALSERALARTLVLPLHDTGLPITSLSPSDAADLWTTQRRSPGELQGEFLVQAIRSVTLHLVLRDGPQLVGGVVGGSADVTNLPTGLSPANTSTATEMAAIAGNSSRTAARQLVRTGDESAWRRAVDQAWSVATDLVKLDPTQFQHNQRRSDPESDR